MALFRKRSAAVYGIDAYPIDVELDMYAGTARDFITVGMPDTAVRQSRERIKSALINSGFGYPNRAVTINLAPANVRKKAAGFDLPMAMGNLVEYYFVDDRLSGCHYDAVALKLVDGGHQVLTAYNGPALRGLEGYVTKLTRPWARASRDPWLLTNPTAHFCKRGGTSPLPSLPSHRGEFVSTVKNDALPRLQAGPDVGAL